MKKRDRWSFGNRLIHMPQKLGNKVAKLTRLEHDLMMVRAEFLRDHARIVELIVLFAATTVTHGKSLDRPLCKAMQQSHDRAGIDAAAEKDPQGHVAAQTQANGALKQ